MRIRDELPRNGFALPSIMISSVVMLAVLLVAVQSVAATRTTLNNQYYQQLAREAVESGVAKANACLADNEYVATWTNARPLRPNTNCSGVVQTSLAPYVLEREGVRTTFRVEGATDTGTGTQSVRSIGEAEQIRRSNNTTWRNHSHTQIALFGGVQNQNHVVLGYATGGSCGGVYFFTFGSNGVARGVGANGCGQIGKGDLSDAITPHTVQLPGGVGVATGDDGAPLIFAHFLSGGGNTVIIGTDGNAYCAGRNDNGSCGIGTTTPGRLTSFTRMVLPAGKVAIYAMASSANSYVITADGHVYATGRCSFGELGDGNWGDGCSNAATPVRMSLPMPNPSNLSTMPATIYLDGSSRYLIMRDGSVYSWGSNSAGQLGLGDKTLRSTPGRVAGYGGASGPRAVRVETIGGVTFILGNDGVVKGAGANTYGRLSRGFVGTGPDCPSNGCPTFEPVQLPPTAVAGSRLVDVRTDNSQVAFLTDKGQVFTSGNNDVGQLGCGTPVDGTVCPNTSGTPVAVPFVLPSGVHAVSIYATSARNSQDSTFCGDNTYAIGSNGRVYGSGCNLYGQLGNGCTYGGSCQLVSGTPVAMSVIDGTSVIATNVTSGRGTTVVRTKDGLIYTVGSNMNGQLGDGTTNDSSIPKKHRFINSSHPLFVF